MWKWWTFLTLRVTPAGLDSLNFAVSGFLWYGKCRQQTSLMGSSRVKNTHKSLRASAWTNTTVAHAAAAHAPTAQPWGPLMPRPPHLLPVRAESSSSAAHYFFLIVFSAIWGCPLWYSDFFRDLDSHTPFIIIRVKRSLHVTPSEGCLFLFMLQLKSKLRGIFSLHFGM